VAFHFFKDEVQHKFEYNKELQERPGSNCKFLGRLLSAQAQLLKDCPDFLAFMYSGTHMDFTEPHLLSGKSRINQLACYLQSIPSAMHIKYVIA
jgi:hypothetical protein